MSGTPDQRQPRSSWARGSDLRPVAIGAAAGLLVLLVGGIALATTKVGPPAAQPLPQMDQGGRPDDGRGGLRPVAPRIRDRSPGGAGPGGGMPGAQLGGAITISAISGSDVTLQSAAGWTRTITVSDATTILRAGQKIAVADLKVGDTVRIGETRNAAGSTAVTEIDVVVPRVLGRVTATAADSIALQRADGTTMTVHVDASTTYAVRGVTNAGLADIKVGMIVLAEGPQNADGSLQAVAVKAAALR